MPERKLAQQLDEKGYRYTQPRWVVLNLLRSATCHPDANWVYDHARVEMPHISLGTVYRTLGVLVDAGLIQALRSEGAQTHYDGNLDPHLHVICTRCAAITDVELELSGQLNHQVAVKTGYRIQGRQVNFYGICPACQASSDRAETSVPSRDGP